jgi:prepilin peptidase CpaA
MSHLMLHSWPSAVAVAMTLASAAVLLLAAGHDIVSRTVPNWMSVAIACCGIAASFAGDRLFISMGLGLAVFIAAAICWRRGWMGGADVKLLGAIAIVLPPGMVATFTIAMSLGGAAHAIIYMVARGMVTPPPPLPAHDHRRRSLLERAMRAERWRISRGGPLPYACAIAFGFVFVVFSGAAP